MHFPTSGKINHKLLFPIPPISGNFGTTQLIFLLKWSLPREKQGFQESERSGKTNGDLRTKLETNHQHVKVFILTRYASLAAYKFGSSA